MNHSKPFLQQPDIINQIEQFFSLKIAQKYFPF